MEKKPLNHSIFVGETPPSNFQRGVAVLYCVLALDSYICDRSLSWFLGVVVSGVFILWLFLKQNKKIGDKNRVGPKEVGKGTSSMLKQQESSSKGRWEIIARKVFGCYPLKKSQKWFGVLTLLVIGDIHVCHDIFSSNRVAAIGVVIFGFGIYALRFLGKDKKAY